jgi:hypothetical protein
LQHNPASSRLIARRAGLKTTGLSHIDGITDRIKGIDDAMNIADWNNRKTEL